jgi:salicylate hydroxylase
LYPLAIFCHDGAMSEKSIAIIGAGIAGLATAIALARRSASISLVEQAPVFSAIGAGLQLGPNAVRALKTIGAWDAVEAATTAPAEIHIREGHSGKILHRVKLGQGFEKTYGAPYRVIHRADLHNALLQVAASRSNINVQMGQWVTPSNWPQADVLIAADGVNSAMRQHLFANTPAIAAPQSILRNLQTIPQRGGNIDFSCVNLWLCAGAHVVHYPLRQGSALNLVASIDGDHQDCTSLIDKCHADLAQLLQTRNHWTRWEAQYVPPLPAWHMGNCLLVGDAAHGTLPWLAQGAAMALEDAAQLSQAGVELVADFGPFQAIRQPRVTRLHAQTLRMAKIYHASGVSARWRNAILRHGGSALMQLQTGWIYRGH